MWMQQQHYVAHEVHAAEASACMPLFTTHATVMQVINWAALVTAPMGYVSLQMLGN